MATHPKNTTTQDHLDEGRHFPRWRIPHVGQLHTCPERSSWRGAPELVPEGSANSTLPAVATATNSTATIVPVTVASAARRSTAAGYYPAPTRVTGVQSTASRALLGSTFAPAARTSRAISASFVTTTT